MFVVLGDGLSSMQVQKAYLKSLYGQASLVYCIKIK
jgi:hypothetical protein